MAKKASTEVVVAGDEQLPDFLREGGERNTMHFDTNDLIIPQIKLMQALSPELEDHADLRVGDFFHNIAEIGLGNSVRIIPLLYTSRVVLWRPRDDQGGGMLARSTDGVNWDKPNQTFEVNYKGRQVTWSTGDSVADSGLLEWGTSNPDDKDSPPAATKTYSYLVMLPDYPDLGVAMLLLSRTQAPIAKKFNSKLASLALQPYSYIFELSSVADERQAGKFKSFAFTGKGPIQDKDVYDAAKAAHETFKGMDLAVKEDRADYEGPSVNAEDREF